MQPYYIFGLVMSAWVRLGCMWGRVDEDGFSEMFTPMFSYNCSFQLALTLCSRLVLFNPNSSRDAPALKCFRMQLEGLKEMPRSHVEDFIKQSYLFPCLRSGQNVPSS